MKANFISLYHQSDHLSTKISKQKENVNRI
jgi:hypothetical protein